MRLPEKVRLPIQKKSTASEYPGIEFQTKRKSVSYLPETLLRFSVDSNAFLNALLQTTKACANAERLRWMLVPTLETYDECWYQHWEPTSNASANIANLRRMPVPISTSKVLTIQWCYCSSPRRKKIKNQLTLFLDYQIFLLAPFKNPGVSITGAQYWDTLERLRMHLRPNIRDNCKMARFCFVITYVPIS